MINIPFWILEHGLDYDSWHSLISMVKPDTLILTHLLTTKDWILLVLRCTPYRGLESMTRVFGCTCIKTCLPTATGTR